MENYKICNCKNVTYFDVQDVLEHNDKFEDVEKAFEEIKNVTKASTGCGGCYPKVINAISEIMSK